MAKLIVLCAINVARYLSYSILEGQPASWTTNMCLDRLDFLEKFMPQWLHWASRMLSPLPKAFPKVWKVYDDGKWTKLCQKKGDLL